MRLVFGGRPPKSTETTRIDTIELPATQQRTDGSRSTRPDHGARRRRAREAPRRAPPGDPQAMIEAVLAIEDRRFYEHPGIDPIGIAGAIFRNVFGNKAYLASGSTITQQLVKNTFLTPEKTPKRKMTEWFMSVVLETRLSKDQILQLYLNDVSLGQRGSFAIHGVAEASRLFFAKDIANVNAVEAATIAGVIQSPSRLSPSTTPSVRRIAATSCCVRWSAPASCRRTRPSEPSANRSASHSARSSRKRPTSSTTSARSCSRAYPQRARWTSTRRSTSTCSGSRDALRDGITRLDEILACRKRRPQAALIAVDPRTGEVLAFVGGRSYNQS